MQSQYCMQCQYWKSQYHCTCSSRYAVSVPEMPPYALALHATSVPDMQQQHTEFQYCIRRTHTCRPEVAHRVLYAGS
eukprot:3941372-Rhodomonas_salina.1